MNSTGPWSIPGALFHWRLLRFLQHNLRLDGLRLFGLVLECDRVALVAGEVVTEDDAGAPGDAALELDAIGLVADGIDAGVDPGGEGAGPGDLTNAEQKGGWGDCPSAA